MTPRRPPLAVLLGWLPALVACAAMPDAGTGAAGPGRGDVLLIVDAQVGVLRSVWEADRLVDRLQALVTKARAAGVPVVWVQHADAELVHGSADWQLAPPFVPQPADWVIHKSFNSSFAGTGLEGRLRQRGLQHIVLAGAATNWCIRATAYGAMDRGFDLTVVADGHSTEPLPRPGAEPVPAPVIIDEFNTVIRWTTAPQVRVQVLPARELVFR